MREPLVDEWINRNSYLVEELPEQGRYFWQVDGLDRENQSVPPSEIRDFTVLAARIYITPEKTGPGESADHRILRQHCFQLGQQPAGTL